jgi:hypothetical protein
VSLDALEAKLLRAALVKRPRAQLKSLFALVRANTDRALLAALAPVKAKARRPDPLVRELERTLRPIMGPAAEKADMLIEFMAKRHRRKLPGDPKGFADAAKRLRAHFSDEQIRAGARNLLAHLAKLYGERETVV